MNVAGLPQEGQPFGRFDITRQIGRGGMGVVYAAVQHGLRREVALKVLLSDYADNEDYRNRFLREAEVLARLDSPHIISVYDAGEQDGWLYIATQLVPDGDLHAMLNSFGPMPIGLALDVTAQVSDGIAAAHRAGIIHRDVKPSNVLLRKLGEGTMQAYVCDLGISRVLDAQHTKTQGVIGTFAYMAPERHEGHDATEASDIYALGCLLWATLSGSAPYVGTDSQVLLGHLSGPIPQLERPDAVGSRINEVLRRSMAKNPADRYPSAEEFAQACAGIVDTLARKPEVASAEAATTVPSNRPPAGDMVQPSSQTPGQQFTSGPQGQFQSGPQGSPHPGHPPTQPEVSPAQMAFAGPPPGGQQWGGPQQAGGKKGIVVAAVVLVTALIVGGAVALALALGGGDDDKSAAGGDDESSQTDDPSSSGPSSDDPSDDDPSSDDPSSDDPSDDAPANLYADVSSAPRDADVGEFCRAFRDFNFSSDYVQGRQTAGNMIEVGTPADFTSSERAGFEKTMEVIQESPTEDLFLDSFSKFSSSEKTDVEAFHQYTKDNC